MLFHCILLLFLSWPQSRATENVDLQDGIIDQVATASDNVVQTTRKPEEITNNVNDTVALFLTDTTIRYENSNDLSPLTMPRMYENDNEETYLEEEENTGPKNSEESKEDTSNVEDNPVFTTEARTLLDLLRSGSNRRSFDMPENQNEFELLKVKNDTPAIANYQDFYENMDGEMKSGNDERKSSRWRNRERGKRIESHMSNYGMDNGRNNNERDSSYGEHYSYNTERDRKKSSAEKVQSNYHQQATVNYNGHGPSSAVRQNAPTVSSPRTNIESNEPAKEAHAANSFDNAASSSSVAAKNYHHRFSRPVVVAEPNHYTANGNTQSSKVKPSPTPYTTPSRADSFHSESNRYNIYVDDGRSFEPSGSSMDSSDDSMDYSEYVERPRKVHKSRRRPHGSEVSRKLPKEHRGSYDDGSEDEDQRKRPSQFRHKGHRHRTKTNSWNEDNRHQDQDESYEESYDNRGSGSIRTESKNVKSQQSPKFKTSNSWSQLTPNVEISHSRGVEIEQPEKPKLIVPVNLLPVGNFDHATALGNSQGFDVSNAVLNNFVTATPLSTSAPVLTTAYSTSNNNQKNVQNLPNLGNFHQVQNVGISTPLPDIIVGQNSFQNSMQTVLVPQTGGQNKVSSTSRLQYLPSTVASIFAVTPTANSMLQSFRVQNVASTVTPRPLYAAMSTVTPGIIMNQVQPTTPHLIFPQPTFGTLPNVMHTPTPTTQYNIQVNPHGLHGQNTIGNPNLQMQNVQLMPTISTTTQSPAVTRVNVIAAGSQNKKNTFPESGGNYLASASLAVGQNGHRQMGNDHTYYVQNQNTQQVYKPQMHDNKQYVQSSQIVPTMLHPNTNLHNFNMNTQQMVANQQNVQDNGFLQQLQLQLQRNHQMFKSNSFPGFTFHTFDNTGSNSNSNVHAVNIMGTQVGAKNVEIMNPTIKPSPVDTTNGNSHGVMNQYALFTTPIPIFATTSNFVTARPPSSTVNPESISVQNYVDSLTEIGAKGNQGPTLGFKSQQQGQERPAFDPINFVPNHDVMKNQAMLNSKANDATQQPLNLVPLVPGGNFFKPSLTAQKDLLTKPKLTSDLEKYAEEMFKESLRTIYNSHKWNNEHKIRGGGQNSSEMDLARLKSELQKLKAALPEFKPSKEILEAHHSENSLRTTEVSKPSSDHKKPDPLLATLEQLLKAHPSEPIQIFSSSNRPNGGQLRPSSPDPGPTYQTDFRHHKHPHHFLMPPKHGSYLLKGHYHDKPGKRPPHHRHNDKRHFHGPRRHPKPNLSPRPGGPEAAASNLNIGVHLDGPRYEHYHGRPSYDRDGPDDFDYQNYRQDHQKNPSSFEPYPTFTTSTPQQDHFSRLTNERKNQLNKDYMDLNHPRMHNLLGLLMKNKQLPIGNSQSVFRDREELKKYFDDEKRKLQQQFFDDTLKNPYLQKRSDNLRTSPTKPYRKMHTTEVFT